MQDFIKNLAIMAFILRGINSVNEFLDRHGDPRVAKFPMMSSCFYTIGLSLLYVYLVKDLGPRLMQNRKPFKLTRVLLVYNLFQVLVSIFLFYIVGMSGWFTGKYSLRCQPIDRSNTPEAMMIVNAAWWYYMAKFTELLDTVFFVLRKKFNQVTTLHVLHHGIMPISVWFGLRIIPGGHSTFFGLINSFVHIIMYGYYFLSALGPRVQKYLWWKKYLTSLQIIQFVAIIVHTFQLLFIDCDFPMLFVWVIGMHGVVFFFLFRQFYKEAYNKKTQKNKTDKQH